MSVSILAVIFDCHDPRAEAEFWARVLVSEVSERNPDEFQVRDPVTGGGSLYFMKVPEPKASKNRLHLDLLTGESMDAEVSRLVAAGAELVDVREDPPSLSNPDRWAVLLDPEGNEFCVTSTATFTGWG